MAGERAEASLAEAAGGLRAAQQGEEHGGCAGCGDGTALGVVWESRLMIIVSWRCHTGLSAGSGRQALLTTISLAERGLGDGFMAFKRPPPLTSQQIAKG